MQEQTKMELGHWEFFKEFNPDEWYGFIYRIIELNTGREYIGRKQFHSHLSKAVPGKKNRKHYKKESNWKKYTGSCAELNKSIEAHGKDNYKFIIESLHKSKGSLHYREAEVHFKEEVLRAKMDNGMRKYYNGQISAVKFIPVPELPEELEMRRLPKWLN